MVGKYWSVSENKFARGDLDKMIEIVEILGGNVRIEEVVGELECSFLVPIEELTKTQIYREAVLRCSCPGSDELKRRCLWLRFISSLSE